MLIAVQAKFQKVKVASSGSSREEHPTQLRNNTSSSIKHKDLAGISLIREHRSINEFFLFSVLKSSN